MPGHPKLPNVAVIVAAGRGERAGAEHGPKQYRRLGGKAVLAHALEPFLSHPAIGEVALVIHRADRELLQDACPALPIQVRIVEGGATRQESVRLGLRALQAGQPSVVLIHDAARPFVSPALLDAVLADTDEGHGAIPAVPVSDTLKREAADGSIFETVPRAGLHAAQTPQAFPYAAILAAHEKAHDEGRSDFTDDAALAEWTHLPVRLVPGDPENTKITTKHDIEVAERRLASAELFPDVRTGAGYDVHAFEPGDAVVLCGVRIPHEAKLAGHSDADVGLHALTDALLATCGGTDIGTHFPPSDPQWRGAASRIFVEHAASLVREKGGRIASADVTLIAEAPKVGPHRPAMIAVMADMLGIEAERVSVKATTNERLGFVGRREGIAAIATVSVVYPGRLPPP
ncbi:MAG TPA: bifunctional 2-C-methyl-D-erythritol 4-phosphate cytidylyltransferase/2-C-methyl-D-erythritol 2,4-cyclodiphosphate synthase [Mesorhizobium sp.]|jgi:2-C-methyl-D-erythritol 4-phosphate cytidylyltransferase/2-C-methyl-D-erythritol 2,4-cyclodiphosphate synthase|nr:bifunctional 2-C-methyl-D-erythritol 4-phosphate cytidylyltransferase/2-C-methyl-D-erythritol 2,4-cyclodiphosphate synthase [Mesorhizobium sp.]